jgi:hypothetical protein
MSQPGRKRLVLIVVIAIYAVGTIIARRRGYPMGGNVVVRCRDGHLYTTIWVPGVSVKSVRLGWWRFQRCPVGNHWSLVSPVKEADLSESERRFAHEHQDVRIP